MLEGWLIQPCVVEIEGNTLLVYRSGPVGTIITWVVAAADACGNVSEQECAIAVIPRPVAGGDDDDDE